MKTHIATPKEAYPQELDWDPAEYLRLSDEDVERASRVFEEWVNYPSVKISDILDPASKASRLMGNYNHDLRDFPQLPFVAYGSHRAGFAIQRQETEGTPDTSSAKLLTLPAVLVGAELWAGGYLYDANEGLSTIYAAVRRSDHLDSYVQAEVNFYDPSLYLEAGIKLDHDEGVTAHPRDSIQNPAAMLSREWKIYYRCIGRAIIPIPFTDAAGHKHPYSIIPAWYYEGGLMIEGTNCVNGMYNSVPVVEGRWKDGIDFANRLQQNYGANILQLMHGEHPRMSEEELGALARRNMADAARRCGDDPTPYLD